MKDHVGNVWGTPQESTVVLLGYKGGFPIFDVDWNRGADYGGTAAVGSTHLVILSSVVVCLIIAPSGLLQL